MFKKPVEFKSQVAVGGKTLKALKKSTAASFRTSDEDGVGRLFGKGDNISCRKVAAGSGASRCSIYFMGDVPILVDDGRGTLFPTAMGLWSAPNLLPTFEVPHPVSRFLCNGADLMLPGVRRILPGPGAAAGSLACACVAGNPSPIAVGVVVFDPSAPGAPQDGKVRCPTALPPGLRLAAQTRLLAPRRRPPRRQTGSASGPGLDKRPGDAGRRCCRCCRCTATACGRPAAAHARTRASCPASGSG